MDLELLSCSFGFNSRREHQFEAVMIEKVIAAFLYLGWKLDAISLVWAFFRPGEKEDSWKYEKKIKEIRMKKSLR